MGLLSWLFGGSRSSGFSPEPDQVFLTRGAKWRALAKAVRARRADGERVVVLAHFPATLRDARDRLQEAEIPITTIDHPLKAGDVPELFERRAASEAILVPVPALTIDSDDRGETHRTDSYETPVPIAILSLEVHPAQEVEADVQHFAAAVPAPTRLFPIISLEDPLMEGCKPERAEGTLRILRMLGVDEDEAVESNIVSRRVRRAQARLSARIKSWEPADSAEEWIAKNIEPKP